MIKINDQFSAERYTYGWELHHTTPSKDKHGNPSTHTRVSYHPNLSMALYAVIDRSVGECTELHEIIDKIDSTVQEYRLATLGASNAKN